MTSVNNIERFIGSRRTDFDLYAPGEHVWQGVEKALDRLLEADPLEAYTLLERSAFDTCSSPDEGLWPRVAASLDRLEGKPLETFIYSERAAFDEAAPDLNVWSAIAAQLPESGGAKVVRVHWHQRLMRIAASIALLVAGVGLGLFYAGGNAPDKMTLSEVSDEYAEIEQFYQRDIATKKQQLARFTGTASEIDLDLVQMDQMMAELQQELANVPPGNQEQVIRAMIENYKAKSDILERVLERMNPSGERPFNSKQQYDVKKM